MRIVKMEGIKSKDVSVNVHEEDVYRKEKEVERLLKIRHVKQLLEEVLLELDNIFPDEG